MKKGPFILFRVFGALLVLGLILGAGAFGYKAGMMRGITQAPEVAAAIEKAAENGQSAPVPPMMYGHGNNYGYGYGYPMHGGHHFGFAPFGICGSIFFLFFFFGFMKMIFFRGMWHGHHHHGHHGPPWMRHNHHNGEENKETEKKDNEKKEETPEEKK